MTVTAGRGGDGCVAFHKPSTPRAPRNPYRLGPPSGGDGGMGGSIYLLPDSSLTSLASVPRKVAGRPGTNGSGEWRNGKRGKDRVVRVPMGSVVRVVGWGGGKAEKGWWVHYPGWEEANVEKEEFREAERRMEREERRRVWEGERKWGAWIEEGREIDVDGELRETEVVDEDNAPLGKKRKEPMGYLIAGGGAGGLGNPHFCANPVPPRYGTRGVAGETLRVCVELKTNADVALVGMCSVGKSTLIRALTGGRVKSDVGEWDGVTRGVVRGVVRVAQGVWEGQLRAGDDGDELSPVPTRPGHGFDLYESFRFMITDNPGFVPRAHITQTILRSIERAKVLVYVVDLSGDAPWDELRVAMQEVARGAAASERKALVVANKADLLAGSEDQVGGAQAKLSMLEDCVRREMPGVEVVPVSAKWAMNLGRVITSLEVLLQK